MLRKALFTLKKNPLIIIMIVLAIILSAVAMLLLKPDINRLMSITERVMKNPDNPDILPQDLTEMVFSVLKLLLYSLVAYPLAIIFISGFGNMLAAAVNGGSASLKIFFYGIRRFFGKTVLSFLLLIAISFGFSFVFSIISFPFTIAGIMNNGTMLSKQWILQLLSGVVTSLLYPLIIMWLPAIYLDRDKGVFACMQNGFKAGLKKYPQLLGIVVAMMLPTILLFVLSENIFSVFDSDGYYFMFAYQMLVLPVLFTYIFTLYKDMRSQSCNVMAFNNEENNRIS